MSRCGEKDQIRGIESSKGVQREGRCRPIAAAQKQALQRTTVDTPANPARDGPPRETESNTESVFVLSLFRFGANVRTDRGMTVDAMTATDRNTETAGSGTQKISIRKGL